MVTDPLDRRTVLKGTGAATVAGLAGCLGDDEADDDDTTDPDDTDDTDDEIDDSDDTDDGDDTEEEDDVIRWGLTPVEADIDVQDQWRALFDYVEEEVGVTIEENVATDYTAVLEAFKADMIDIAGTPHTVAIFGDDEDVTDVLGLRRAQGNPYTFCFITTMPEDDITDMQDLEGTEIAFPDPLSTPGALWGLWMLSEAGLDVGDAPDGDPVDFEASYSDHAVARNELINQPGVTAAATGSFAVVGNIPEDQLPDYYVDIDPDAERAGTDEPELNLLQASEPIPQAPMLVRRNWDSPIREDVEQAILDAPPEAFVAEDAEVPLWFDGVEEGDMSEYEPVRDVMRHLGIDPEMLG